MNVKMITNLQQSTTKSKKSKTNKAHDYNRNRLIGTEIIWRIISREGDGGEWGKRYRD